jgi:MoxR-like ATPase
MDTERKETFWHRVDGPLMFVIVVAACCSLVYVWKDYADSGERQRLYNSITSARRDEREVCVKERATDVQSYQERATLRDKAVQALQGQNDYLIRLMQESDADRKRAIALSTQAKAKATQAADVAQDTNKKVDAIIVNKIVPETTVKKLNEQIRGVNKK